MSTYTSTRKTDYLSQAEARRRLRCGPIALGRLIREGRLGTLAVPGLRLRVSAEDVDRLVREGLRPATTHHRRIAKSSR